MYPANRSVASLQIICDGQEEQSEGLSPWQGYGLHFWLTPLQPRQQFWKEDRIWLDDDQECVIMEVQDADDGWSYQLRVLGQSELYKDGRWVLQRKLSMSKRGPKHGGK
jgi:hypothetical protein